MNCKYKRLTTFVMAILIGVAQYSISFGQSDSAPIKKNGLEVVVEAPSQAEPGATFDLDLKLSIPNGFHIYGSKDQTMPTELTLDEVEGVVFSQPEIPKGAVHTKSGMTNYWLEGEQTIRTKVSVSESVEGKLKFAGNLKFMICNDQACKPPAKIPFEVSVAVKGESKSKSGSNDTGSNESQFESPVQLKADGEIISTEEPGYASPCLADIDGDGKKDLLVGQFNDGKIKVYHGLGDGKFSKGKWLKAGGKTATVPGVW